MKGSQDQNFKNELKALIIEVCDLDLEIDDVKDGDDGPMFGPTSSLGLDSIDALQISIALQNKYGVTITDSKEMRRVMVSLNSFADFLQPK